MRPFEWVARQAVVDCPEYLAEVELYRNAHDECMVFCHFEFRKFSKEALRKALAQFQSFRSHVKCTLFAHGEIDDKKFEKFARLFGFVPLMEAPCTDGKTRRIFINKIR